MLCVVGLINRDWVGPWFQAALSAVAADLPRRLAYPVDQRRGFHSEGVSQAKQCKHHSSPAHHPVMCANWSETTR